MPSTKIPTELINSPGLAKAWVSFDATRNAAGGTDSANTNRFIIASYNVDSVLKTATGEHTATLTAGVFADGNYCAMGMGRGNALVALGTTAQTATACYVTTRVNSTAAPNDSPYNSLVIFD